MARLRTLINTTEEFKGRLKYVANDDQCNISHFPDVVFSKNPS